MRLLHIFLATGVLLTISVTIWITFTSAKSSLSSPARVGREVLRNSREFDTTGGQEMKPRWND